MIVDGDGQTLFKRHKERISQ